MFNLLKEASQKIITIIQNTFHNIEEDVLNNLIVEFPENDEHGDITNNAGMILSKTLKKSPRLIAEEISQEMKNCYPEIEKVEIAGPGFMNSTLNNKFWLTTLNKILSDDESYGSSYIGCKSDKSKQKVNLEFCSANPTGPLHLGHIRGAIWGDAVAKILSFAGYDVEKEYYINDLGGQIEQLINTAYLRYQELFGIPFELKPGCYPGAYLIQTAEKLKEEFGDSLLNKSPEELQNLLQKPVINHMVSIIKDDLTKLNIEFNNWTYESDITNSKLVEESFDILKSKDLIYEGVLERPKGHSGDDEDYQGQTQILFASTKLGDESDRALKRSDGEWAYFAKDVAYHFDKIKRQYDWLILEVGIDHNGYKKRMIAAVNALSDGKQKFSFEFHNMVYIYEDGIQQKMSKRSGKAIGAEEIIDMIGLDVLRFYVFSKRHDVELDFDIKTANEASKNNPYFYIQYAYARSCSILRNAKEKIKNLDLQESEFCDIIVNSNEKKLIKKLALWPHCVEATAKSLEPHKINFYLQDLATEFHSLWNLGSNDKALRFINDCRDEKEILMTKYRINLVKAAKQTIGIGLKLLGVKPLEQM
jgi:arginyl-tRNA synthetase